MTEFLFCSKFNTRILKSFAVVLIQFVLLRDDSGNPTYEGQR